MRIQRFSSWEEMYPRGYGLAWRDATRAGDICYPVPLNLGARWLRGAYRWLQHGYAGGLSMEEQRDEALKRVRALETREEAS